MSIYDRLKLQRDELDDARAAFNAANSMLALLDDRTIEGTILLVEKEYGDDIEKMAEMWTTAIMQVTVMINDYTVGYNDQSDDYIKVPVTLERTVCCLRQRTWSLCIGTHLATDGKQSAPPHSNKNKVCFLI